MVRRRQRGGDGAARRPSRGGGTSNGDAGAGGESNEPRVGATCASLLARACESECRDGACAITTCQAGFLDANGTPGDGCEAGDVPKDALTLWFMADRGVSSDQVSAWEDQSAAHVTASATTAAAMPQRVAQASGPPMIEFDGADDGLKLPEGFATFNGASFFAVTQAHAAKVCAGILSLSNGNDGDDIEFGRHTTNLLYYEVLGEFVEGADNAFEANKRLLVSVTQDSTGAVELRIKAC